MCYISVQSNYEVSNVQIKLFIFLFLFERSFCYKINFLTTRDRTLDSNDLNIAKTKTLLYNDGTQMFDFFCDAKRNSRFLFRIASHDDVIPSRFKFN